ncbi:MAG: glycosyltransferase [Pseudomonadota bacterium]
MHTVLLLGPALHAVSGVSTHLNQLFGSALKRDFRLLHFQVGSQGRDESPPRKAWRLLASPFKLLACLLRERPAIVHVNTSMDAKGYWRDIAYLAIAHALGKKVIYQVHGGALPQQFFQRSRALTALLRRVLRSVEMVLVLGNESLLAYRRFAPELRLRMIANAVDAGPDPHWKRARAADGVLTLVFIGRLVADKGVFDIVEALAILVRERRQVRLVFAGSGSDEARLRLRVRQLQLDPWVDFVGVIEGQRKERLWQESDLFVCPTYREALPYSLLESMAARTPALICPVGAIPDVMADGIHGLFVPIGDPPALAKAIGRLDQDRALIGRMGELSRQRVLQAYTVERLASDIGQLYRAILPAGVRP